MGRVVTKIKIIVLFFLFCTLPSTLGAQSVGLVLSGGGAKGLSHIGVIKALEENDIPIDYISGTSIGAIIGALYAIGYTPDEMVMLFKSKAFESWYSGLPEREYASFFDRGEFLPKMVDLSFRTEKNGGKESKIALDLPTSIISPYPMDLAFLQIFMRPTLVCDADFNKLMVPFFCIASDVAHKKEVVLDHGNLGSAVRASMTYPLFFKPIIRDSVMLFDGGFYNNFPWKDMIKRYDPGIIIGSKCVKGNVSMSEDDLYSQLANMMMDKTDFDIPAGKSVLINGTYDFGLLDFSKADKIVQLGYENAMAHMAEIKAKITARRTATSTDSLRRSFKKKLDGKIMFSQNINIRGNLNAGQKHFISRTIRRDKNVDFDFDQLKRGYNRVFATKMVKTFYPSFTKINDSLCRLDLRVTKASPWSLELGGNISSSSLNQGYVGVSYLHFSKNPWKLYSGINMGRYYKGAVIEWRHDIDVHPLAYYSFETVAHQFDYFNGNQNLFASSKLPNNIQNREIFGRLDMAVALSVSRNVLAKFSLIGGNEHFQYFRGSDFSSDDVHDRTNIALFSSAFGIERNTINYAEYATAGRNESISVRYDLGKESYTPGTTSPEKTPYDNRNHNKFLCRLYMNNYILFNRHFHLGYLADITLSSQNNFNDYISTVLYMPVFEPVPHSKTLMMKGYRSYAYIGTGLSPVFLFTKSFYLHTNISYFQPYKAIKETENGGFEYSGTFPKGSLIADLALVWHTPIGPVSVSSSYYEKGDYKWYTQLNIGYIIFRKRALEY
ncbi:MAG: patatin-like phospholipase family protein [Bacteroidales bacterium]|nr:patatin-like phospholipase family protein [Bacteroidales bacterium]